MDSVSFPGDVLTLPMYPGRDLLVSVQSLNRGDLAAFVQENRELIESKLLEHGAILFRDFAVDRVEDFDAFASALSSERLDYTYRSSPRTSVGNKLFTATEYPADREIDLHNENSFQRSWPRKIAFCCLVASAVGGETPLADMRRVTTQLDPAVLQRFRTRGVRYIRHYHPHIDLSWQTVFQTEDRDAVASICAHRDIAHEWLSADILRTAQSCHGTAQHPVTGEQLFFNQAHMFHASSLPPDMLRDLEETVGRDRLPRHTTFGDGMEIPEADLSTLRSALRREATAFRWQRGDVLLLDNMLVAHGRRTFRGDRRVLVSMFQQYSPPSLAA